MRPGFLFTRRIASSCALVVLSVPLAAQDFRATWTLVLPPESSAELSGDQGDEDLVALIAAQDLTLDILPTEQVANLAGRPGNPEPCWVLKAPDGRITKRGSGLPSAGSVRAAFSAAGLQPRLDVLQSFARSHPDCGEVLEALLPVEMDLHQVRKQRLQSQQSGDPFGPAFLGPESTLPAELKDALAELHSRFLEASKQGKWEVAMRLRSQAQHQLQEHWREEGTLDGASAFGGLIELLDNLSRLPDLERANLDPLLATSRLDLDHAPAPFRAALDRLEDALFKALQRRPNAPRLSATWSRLATRPGRDSAGDRLMELSPLPRQPWPKLPILRPMADRYLERRDWEGLLTFVDPLKPNLDKGMSESAWQEYRALRAALAGYRAAALARLDRLGEAKPILSESRRWAGSLWPSSGIPELMRGNLPELSPDPKDPLTRLITGTPDVDPPPPLTPEPARLVLLGKPAWRGMWEALRFMAPLAPWGPDELRWEEHVKDEAAFRQRLGLAQGSGWALLRGGAALAQGETCPSAEHLAALMEEGGPTRLQELDALLREHPDHVDAHAARFQLLLPRMPHPALEGRLAQDARLSETNLPFGPEAAWHPDAGIWGKSAALQVPEIEAALARWPNRADLWRAWLSWSAFLPQTPSPLDLDQRLPRWRAESPLSPSRKAVNISVANALRHQGRHEDMANWFRAELARLERLHPAVKRGSEGGDGKSLRREAEAVIVAPLRDALLNLGRIPELQALEAELEPMPAP